MKSLPNQSWINKSIASNPCNRFVDNGKGQKFKLATGLKRLGLNTVKYECCSKSDKYTLHYQYHSSYKCHLL